MAARAAVFVALTAVVLLCAAPPARADFSGNVGDADCSGAVDAVDAVLLLQRGAGLLAAAPCEKNADVSEDGVVSSADAAFVLQYVARLIPVLPPPSVVLADVPTSCPQLAQLTDGAIMAHDIVARGSDQLLLHRGALITLGVELDGVLALVREAAPELAAVHPRNAYRLGGVWVTAGAALSARVRDLLDGRPERVTFVTGFDGFDALNTRLRLLGFEVFLLDVPGVNVDLSLCFPQHVNVPVAAEAFGALDEVVRGAPAGQVGDGPDVDALKDEGAWYLVFRDAYDDCEAGCVIEEFSYVTVIDGVVTLVGEAEALEDLRFVALRCLTGAHDCAP